jgi:hypothetical protein
MSIPPVPGSPDVGAAFPRLQHDPPYDAQTRKSAEIIRFPGPRASAGDENPRRALPPAVRVLFICRTQEFLSPMAAELARAAFDPLRVHVQSAGLHPRAVDTRAIEVMRDIGLDISRTPMAAVRSLDLTRFAVVVSIGVHRLGLPRGQRAIAWPAPECGPSASRDSLTGIRRALVALSARMDGLARMLETSPRT